MLAKWNLAAATLKDFYVCAATTRMVGEVSFTNTTVSDIKVRLAIKQGAGSPTVANGEFLEYDTAVGASGVKGNGPLTRSVVLLPGQILWAYSDVANVNVSLIGIEE
ncbi:MAG: hypothetical protein K2Y56_24145 [Methylobacterium sp.]|uniref:hypothetical protein n=1 Tax=Methylobacterium sp. TaxID=409 RepID=UPI0025DCBFE5|nr:hypothetical protein [Methylobacterium sp.]MBX9934570.1 hypothetical protein [Methylobacterium sp.]